MKDKKRLPCSLVSVVGAALLCVANSALAEEQPGASGNSWAWSITPYMWFTDTSLDLKADGQSVGGADISFGDLIDTIDTAVQLQVETGPAGGKWTGFIDMTYLETSDDNTYSIEIVPINIRVDSDSEQLFVDAAIAYWPYGNEGPLSFYGGLRYTDLDDEYRFSNADTSTALGALNSDRSFTDALVGGRYFFTLGENWGLYTRADYAFGDSEALWLAQAMLRYAVGSRRQHGIMAGYRYKEAEYEKDGVTEEYEYSGPAVAFNFRF